MENHSHETQPSLLIVDPDKRTRSILESFFTRMGWTLKSWDGTGPVAGASLAHGFDLVIADALILASGSLAQLRDIDKPTSSVPLVVLVNSSTSPEGLVGAKDVWCCIDKESEPRSIECSLECLVGEFQRLRRDGGLAQRARTPVEASVVIESFTSKELAESGYHFPILVQLENAGLLALNDKLRLQLALQEAIANSLEHGNLELVSNWKEEINSEGFDKFSQIKLERLSDPQYGERMITIVSDFDCSRLLLRITDQGKGFEVPSVDSLKTKDKSLAVFGRGMAIINNAMDEVSYGLGGRQITLVKKIFAQGDE